MDIRKITLYSAEALVGCLLGGIFFAMQLGIWWLTLKVSPWKLICFPIHFVNGMLIIGSLGIVADSFLRRWQKPQGRRGIIADLTLGLWVIAATVCVWMCE